MLNQKITQDLDKKFEKKIKGIFKKYDLEVISLEKKLNISRRPEFLVRKKGNPEDGFICECKYIHSADIIDNGRYHVSTLDENLSDRNKGAFRYDSSGKLEEVVGDARNQFLSLIENYPEYSGYPFVIALETDFFVNFNFIPKDIYGLQEVSAVFKIERDYELRKELKKFTAEELENIINGKVKKKLPQQSVRFKVLLNPQAKVKFKPNLFLRNPIII